MSPSRLADTSVNDRRHDSGDSISSRRRRRLVRATASGVIGAFGLAATGATGAGQQDPSASVTFEKQESDGKSVVVASVSTGVDAKLLIMEQRSGKQEEELYRQRDLPAGTDERNLVVQLEKPIGETETIKAVVLTEGDEFLTQDEAIVAIGEDKENLGVTFVEANPDAGFHYPYYLYNPSTGGEREVPILVEPNNTGTATDDIEKHRKDAKHLVERNGTSRTISDELDVPMLVPVFPRPLSEPVDSQHYTHQLDRDTLAIENGSLERIDLQLLRMVDHAIARLTDAGRTMDNRIIMNGFSASGNFVDRFAVLHPERVLSVTAGGLNGMTLLPLTETNGHTLNYHIGIADVETLTGKSIDLDALNEVNQFLYMGGEDDNDTIPYDDAWTSEEMRRTALAVYGEDMIEQRFPYCQTAYTEAGVEAQFRIYEGTGHTPRPAMADIIEFHRRSIVGEDVSDFGDDLSSWASGTSGERGSRTSEGGTGGRTADSDEAATSGDDPGFSTGLGVGFGAGVVTTGLASISYFKGRSNRES